MVIDASINNSRFFRKYVEIINVLFNLSNREMDILALLIELDYNWHTDKYKNILDSSSRKYIMQESRVNKSNLSRYISLFKEKRIIVENNNGWEIRNKFVPTIEDNKLVILFNLNLINNDK